MLALAIHPTCRNPQLQGYCRCCASCWSGGVATWNQPEAVVRGLVSFLVHLVLLGCFPGWTCQQSVVSGLLHFFGLASLGLEFLQQLFITFRG